MARALSVMTLAAFWWGASACSPTRAENPYTRAEVTLQLFGDPHEMRAYRAMIAEFEKVNADVTVELRPVGKLKDHMVKLTTSFIGRNPPDLFLLNYRRFGQFAEKGVLEPLGEQLARSQVLKLDDFFEVAVDAFRWGDTLPCLPQNVSSLVIYYNRALFDRYQVPYPRPEWTKYDFINAARRLTHDVDGDGMTDIYGFFFEPLLIRLAPWVWQADGRLVDYLQNPTKFMLTDTGSKRAINFVRSLRTRYRVVPSLAEAKAEPPEARFAHGRLAMFPASRRLTTTLRTLPNLDWDVAPLPRAQRASSLLHADAYCMAKSSTVKAQAFRFVEFALGPVGARLLASTGRTVPSLKSVAHSQAFLDPKQKPASAKVFLDAIPLLERVPNIGAWNEIESRADPIVEEWFFGPTSSSSWMSPYSAGVKPVAAGGAGGEAGEDTSVELANELYNATRDLFGER